MSLQAPTIGTFLEEERVVRFDRRAHHRLADGRNEVEELRVSSLEPNACALWLDQGGKPITGKVPWP